MLIKNARLVLKGNETIIQDVLIEDNKFVRIEDCIDLDTETIDLEEKLLLPGGVDVHVHLREPGFCHKETITTASLAALAGGYTTLCAMPNVMPMPDNAATVIAYLKLINLKKLVNIYPYGCITKGLQGLELTDFKALKSLGINWLSDDGVGVQSVEMMRSAMLKAKQNDMMIVAHAEDMDYVAKGGSVHLGMHTERLGLVGISSKSEYLQVERDLKLALETSAKYHVCHLSTKESVDLLRKYQALGANVSGEVTCHHLLLCDEDVTSTMYKMNPPLRSKQDQEALIEGLLDGTIAMIANDHAPHTNMEKAQDFDKAPFGIVGLETSVVLLYTHLVESGIATLEQFSNWISASPAKRFGLEGIGKIEVGYTADCFVLVEQESTIDKDLFLSKSNNTPFDGCRIKASVEMCFVSGKLVYEHGGI